MWPPGILELGKERRPQRSCFMGNQTHRCGPCLGLLPPVKVSAVGRAPPTREIASVKRLSAGCEAASAHGYKAPLSACLCPVIRELSDSVPPQKTSGCRTMNFIDSKCPCRSQTRSRCSFILRRPARSSDRGFLVVFLLFRALLVQDSVLQTSLPKGKAAKTIIPGCCSRRGQSSCQRDPSSYSSQQFGRNKTRSILIPLYQIPTPDCPESVLPEIMEVGRRGIAREREFFHAWNNQMCKEYFRHAYAHRTLEGAW